MLLMLVYKFVYKIIFVVYEFHFPDFGNMIFIYFAIALNCETSTGTVWLWIMGVRCGELIQGIKLLKNTEILK